MLKTAPDEIRVDHEWKDTVKQLEIKELATLAEESLGEIFDKSYSNS